jgi:ring-1,2-phenylacetyl-CoA epoxidase subunit PaaC
MDETEIQLAKAGVIPNLKDLKPLWMEQVLSVLNLATLKLPENQGFFGAGRQGRHSEYMGFILAQLQYMQRVYPNMQW